MRNKLGYIYVAVLFISIFFSSMTGYIAGMNSSKSTPAPTKKSQAEKAPFNFSQPLSKRAPKSPSTNALEKKPSCYILREDNGSITLFFRDSSGNEKLWQTYDTPVKALPQSDRNQLKEGIEISSISEALKIIEDYSS